MNREDFDAEADKKPEPYFRLGDQVLADKYQERGELESMANQSENIANALMRLVLLLEKKKVMTREETYEVFEIGEY